MKKFLPICFLLAACSNSTQPTHIAGDTAHQTIASIRESLSAECKTEAIDKQLDAADAAVTTVVNICDMQIDRVEQEKLRWKIMTFVLMAAIAAYVARKLMK